MTTSDFKKDILSELQARLSLSTGQPPTDHRLTQSQGERQREKAAGQERFLN